MSPKVKEGPKPFPAKRRNEVKYGARCNSHCAECPFYVFSEVKGQEPSQEKGSNFTGNSIAQTFGSPMFDA